MLLLFVTNQFYPLFITRIQMKQNTHSITLNWREPGFALLSPPGCAAIQILRSQQKADWGLVHVRLYTNKLFVVLLVNTI